MFCGAPCPPQPPVPKSPHSPPSVCLGGRAGRGWRDRGRLLSKNNTEGGMPRRGILFAFVAMLACAGAVQAQDGMRLSIDRLGDIRTGAYSISNGAVFTLDHYTDKYLMRFVGEPEIYVLYADSSSMGGRILKFDSGGTALQVSGWGALTIYTDAQPSGLPAERP